MIDEMTLRNFTPTTQQYYLYSVTRLAKYYKRSPNQLYKEQIRSYLLFLELRLVDRCYHRDPRRLQWLIICDDVNGKDEGSESGHLHQRGEIHRKAVSFNDALIES